jgi:hypothetical protein
MTDHDDPGADIEQTGPDEHGSDDESLLDELRGTGVGVEDPNIVGDPHPGLVDEQVAKDEPPRV